MGPPISPVTTDFVMEEMEEIAITAAPHPPNMCLNKEHVDESKFTNTWTQSILA